MDKAQVNMLGRISELGIKRSNHSFAKVQGRSEKLSMRIWRGCISDAAREVL